jgi:hypothetical protein
MSSTLFNPLFPTAPLSLLPRAGPHQLPFARLDMSHCPPRTLLISHELVQFVQQRLQVVVADLVCKARYERLRLVGRLAT